MKYCGWVLSVLVVGVAAQVAAAQPCVPAWEAMGDGVNMPAYAGVVYDDGGGPDLYVAGQFTTAGGVTVNRVGRWNGSAWSALGTGEGVNLTAITLAVFNDGGGSALYAGGVFTMAGGNPATRIAKWNGTTWSAVGAGFNSNVQALAVYDDGGGGPALYAGGVFVTSGTTTVNRIAKWNGTEWLPLGTGLDGTVQQLLVHNDGSGSALYACGFFTSAGGVPGTAYLARWNGTAWGPVGLGAIDGVTRAIGVYDDGNGAALYACVDWYSCPTCLQTGRIAKWNGTSWSDVGPPPAVGVMSGFVVDFAVFDDGTGGGPALIAAGTFTTIGGITANRVAKWDGTAWSPVHLGIFGGGNVVNSLEVANLGAGPTLYAIGGFSTAGTASASRVAQLHACQPAGVCCRGSTCNAGVAQADCNAAEPAGALFVSNTAACNAVANSTSPCCYADFNKTGGITVGDIFDFLNSWFSGSPLAHVGGDGASGTLSVGDIFNFLNAWFEGGC